jgi:hypothetical protein
VVRVDPEDQASEDAAVAEPAAEAPAAEAPVADETAPPPGKRSRSKRASVPTWDEIMFGPKD